MCCSTRKSYFADQRLLSTLGGAACFSPQVLTSYSRPCSTNRCCLLSKRSCACSAALLASLQVLIYGGAACYSPQVMIYYSRLCSTDRCCLLSKRNFARSAALLASLQVLIYN